MVQISLRLSPGANPMRRAFNRSIVAWGDSLTAGSGVAGSLSYPVQAAALFDDARGVIAKGIGGQTAEQIAARQGGRAIFVSLAGDAIGAKGSPLQSWSFDFASIAGWTKIGSSGLLDNSGNILRRSGVTDNLGGTAIALGKTVPSGHTITATFDLTEYSGGSNVVKIKLGPASSSGSVGTWQGMENVTADAIGRHVASHSVNGASALAYAFRFNGTPVTAASFAIDNLVIEERAPYAGDVVTTRTINILQDSGVFTGSASGTLGGRRGTMLTDSAGNWSFSRIDDGDAVPCPAGTVFLPDEARSLREHVAWIWAGNNGVTADPSTVSDTLSHIAAMVGHLSHRRFLVAGTLTRSSDSEDLKGQRLDLNARLSARYGARYVDLPGVLMQAHNGSAEDLADIAAQLVPRSLRIDAVHLNGAGYAIVAQAMHAATTARGW